MLARVARDLEATAYRRLRDLEAGRETHGAGSPRRVKRAFHKQSETAGKPGGKPGAGKAGGASKRH
jgi:hypothetical protein